jgi:hypothetical protein
LFAENSNNLSSSIFPTSISFDPITFIQFLLPDDNIDIKNMWLAMELNGKTTNEREFGLGVILRRDRIGLTARHRSFSNKEQLSGFFWGLFGLLEWRRMFWYYNENYEMGVGWTFPLGGHDNSYHSIGITGGIEAGFRIRRNDFGITPFFGMGIPLFYCFGNLPPQSNMQEFYASNILLRAVNVGIRLDFFTPTHRRHSK